MSEESDRRRSSQAPPSNVLEVDFALVLARLIEVTRNDPVRLRASIYELARRKLREQFTHESSEEKRRMIHALETAIEGVESFAEKQADQTIALVSVDHRSGRSLSVAADMAGSQSIPVSFGSPNGRDVAALPHPDYAVGFKGHRSPARFGTKSRNAKPTFFLVRALVILAITAAAVAAGIYIKRHPALIASLRGFVGQQPEGVAVSVPPRPSSTATEQVRSNPQAVTAVGDPLLPKTFGIYAISGNRLFELEPLPGRVPDQRVAMSAAITSPSRTMLPDGKIRFIVYRRDSVSSAADRAEVRVVATVKSAMTFDSAGKPKVAATQDSWVIRNVAFGYRVAPVKDNADMYEVRHEDEQFALRPGRYAVVIKGAAYDFTVAGKIADRDHCLERIEAANGAFYSPCATP